MATLETIGEFTVPAPPAEKTCETPGSCKNPSGRLIRVEERSFYITNRATGAPVLVCLHCKQHMDQKPTTVTRTRAATSVPFSPTQEVLHSVDSITIRAASSASQRGDLIRTRVAPIPYTPQPSRYNQSPSNHSLFSQAPSTYVPGPVGSPGRTGYSQAHTRYPEARGRVMQLRSSSDPLSLEVCTVSYTVESQLGKAKRSSIIFEIPADGIANVDARSTGSQLKEMVLQAMADNWDKYTYGFPLIPGHFTLRLTKSNIDLAREFKDSPAIYEQCLTRRGQVKGRFAFGQVVSTHMLLDAMEYEAVESHVRESKAMREDASHEQQVRAYEHAISWREPATLHPHPSNSIPTKATPRTPTRAHSKRSLPLSPSSPPQSPPHKRIAGFQDTEVSNILQVVGLPSAATPLDQALRAHGQEIQLLQSDGAKTSVVHFYHIPAFTFLELLSEAKTLPTILNDITLCHFGHLAFNTSPSSRLGSGRFKHCFLGSLFLMSAPLSGLGSGDRIVALKRPYKEDPSNPGKTIRLQHNLELQAIITEAATWQWSNCLLNKVYDFIWAQPTWNADDAPVIPILKFVQLGIAKRVLPGAVGSKSFDGRFLVEERIPAEHGFVRFLGNGSAVPCVFPFDTLQHRVAQFCSFAQHVQWVLTDGRVFCADWQGGIDELSHNVLLSDPQIITHPSLGQLFADGNIDQTFILFPEDHCCDDNVFCLYFKPGPIILPNPTTHA